MIHPALYPVYPHENRKHAFVDMVSNRHTFSTVNRTKDSTVQRPTSPNSYASVGEKIENLQSFKSNPATFLQKTGGGDLI